MAGQLEGRVAVVTGSGQGIGRAVALHLAGEGARIVVNSRTEASRDNTTTAADTADEIRAAGGEAVAVFADVGRMDGAKRVIEAAADTFGGLDILINNAGASFLLQPVEDLPEADWDAILDSNLRSQYACSHVAVPHLKRRGAGRIINMSSGVGLYGLTNMSAYAAAKAGTLGFSFTLANELVDARITVNCILPSAATERTNRTRAEREAKTGRRMGPTPARTPEAIAPVVTFLASGAAAGISGQAFLVAGGLIKHFPWPPTEKTLFKHGQWTLDELMTAFPAYFGAQHAPPKAPPYF